MGYNKWDQKALAKLKNMKLQSKFMAGYLIACAFPLLVVSSIIYSQSAAGLEDSSQEFAALYTSQIENSLNELMKEYDKVTKSVLIDNDLISKVGDGPNLSMNEYILQKLSVQRVLMRVALLKSEINNVMLISRDNSVYQYTNTSSTVNESALMSQEWYKQARSSGDTLFITGLHDRSYYEDKGQGALVTVGRVLLSSEGAFAGVLLIDLDPFTLMELNHEFVLTRDKYGMSVIISKLSGETVYHSDAASGRVPWMQVLEAGIDYTKDVSNSDQIVISGSTQLGNLVIKTEIPREKLLQKITRIKVVTIILIIIGFLITVLISLGLSLRITKPIKALRRSMKQAETGQYLPIESIQANDEIGSLVYSYNKMIVVIRTLIEDVYIAEIKQRKAKFLALQNQINPHMLYNTLESIRMKALVKEEEEIAGMIKILARMFRLTLGKDGKQHSIKHEIDYTLNYLQLQNIRFGDSFLLDIRMPEEMQQCNIIPLVFQPIVENSIIHGFQGYEGSMHIVIEGMWTADGGIMIRILDDGIGISGDKQEELRTVLEDAASDKYKLEETEKLEGEGLGLKNIAERITLHYGDLYKLTVRSGGDKGTIVEILIPKY
ncbi:histidine kinase [Paenibacillus sp. HWE-109]|uniref:cache domain-containing sensor histidine kinase n=1 Tax=Paenibacillus sp. HWE-109 TaxID=1306526 RepID=UPI001EE0E8BF|nr:sensor histidine kinase [Paenibacillus sp. HWE-109]UKS26940.1 histidine kinase [Paenibacillus sp. HWE-109]